MTWFFLTTSIICGSITLSMFVIFILSLCFDDPNYYLVIGIVLFEAATFFSLDAYYRNVKQESKEIVITTSMPAKIDTTIVIKNGVSDTTYTYHLMKE